MTTTSVSNTSAANSGTDSTQATTQTSSTAKTSDAQSAKKTSNQTTSQQDEVKISAAAQAKSLKQQGESVKMIAQALGVTTKVVDTYLGIPETKGGSSGAAAQYSASQVSQMLGNL